MSSSSRVPSPNEKLTLLGSIVPTSRLPNTLGYSRTTPRSRPRGTTELCRWEPSTLGSFTYVELPPSSPNRSLTLTSTLQNYTGGAKNGGQHVTDYTNASRTLLLDLHTQEWSKELLDFFECPEEVLPKIVSNSEPYGEFYEGHVLEGVPIAGLVGDQQAALVGNKCLSKGEAKQTYGELGLLALSLRLRKLTYV